MSLNPISNAGAKACKASNSQEQTHASKSLILRSWTEIISGKRKPVDKKMNYLYIKPSLKVRGDM